MVSQTKPIRVSK